MRLDLDLPTLGEELLEEVLTPQERRKYLELCYEHSEVVVGFFLRDEPDKVATSAVVRKIRRELDWYIALQQRRWRLRRGNAR